MVDVAQLVHEKLIGISWITHTSLSDDEGLFSLLADRVIDWLCGIDASLNHTVTASDGNICTKRRPLVHVRPMTTTSIRRLYIWMSKVACPAKHQRRSSSVSSGRMLCISIFYYLLACEGLGHHCNSLRPRVSAQGLAFEKGCVRDWQTMFLIYTLRARAPFLSVTAALQGSEGFATVAGPFAWSDDSGFWKIECRDPNLPIISKQI